MLRKDTVSRNSKPKESYVAFHWYTKGSDFYNKCQSNTKKGWIPGKWVKFFIEQSFYGSKL